MLNNPNKVTPYPQATNEILFNLYKKISWQVVLLLAPDAPLAMKKVDRYDTFTVYEESYAGHIVVPTSDFFDFFDYYKRGVANRLFDAIVALRVLEHIPVRQIDWFVYQLSTIIRSGGYLVIVVPDMWEAVNRLREVEQNMFDWFEFCRLNYEILSEGDHVYDRHATWTDELSIKRILTQEKLFEIEEIKHCYIDTDIPELLVVAKRT